MEEEFNESQDVAINEVNRNDSNANGDTSKDFGEISGFEEEYGDDEATNNFRSTRGRGNFRGRGRGPPPGWMNGPPPRFRGRGYGPGGPPMRGRGFFRGRGGPRGFGPNNGPNFDNNWGPMGPPPPNMMGGPPPFGPPPGMMGPGGPMGPPNMMVQPPPFGGPPGMPPPNMLPPDVWVETKSEDGKSYYYHARTRETTWTRPQESPTCKLVTQSEMLAMVAAGQMPNISGPQSMPMNGPMGAPMVPPIGGPMGMMPNGMMGGMMPPGVNPPPGTNVPPPFLNQPPPWIKDSGNRDMKPDTNSPNEEEIPPGETTSQVTQPTNELGFVPGSTEPWANNWAWPPPLAQPPPLHNTSTGPTPMSQLETPVVNATTTPTAAPAEPVNIQNHSPAAQPAKEEIIIPPELIAKASEWTVHKAPDGRPYYYNSSKQDSVWEKPQPLKDLEALQAKIAAEKEEKPEKKTKKNYNDVVEVIDVEAHAEAAEAERRAAANRAAQAELEKLEREEKEREKERERLEKEKSDKEKAKQDKSRPIYSTPISGTPWRVVWTGDGRIFFYNPTAHLSVWERPAQLIGRPDVDHVITNPPEALQTKYNTFTSTPKTTNGELKRNADSDTDDSEVLPAKKFKLEESKLLEGLSGVMRKPVEVVSSTKELAKLAEMQARKLRETLPHEQRVQTFRQMLAEKDVSAYGTWESQLNKIVYDNRYLLLESQERKQVYDKYVRERVEEERKEKKNRLLQKKNAFRSLMEEAKLYSKSSFSKFSSKYSRDERYKAIEKHQDRENYFNEYIAEVRKKEKEEKEKKREQVKNDFITLLKDKFVDRHARWIDIKKKVDSDSRYKAVESSSLREDYFREYCKIVKEERKKDKDKELDRERLSSKKEKREKDKDKEREKEAKKDKRKEKSEKVQADTKGNVSAANVNEELAAKEREARAQASIKEREKEVQRALATSLRDRDKEREFHKRDEAVQHFNALLADLVRNADLAWREAKKQLKKDHRYGLAGALSKEDKERLFSTHTSALAAKRRDKLRALLDELNVAHDALWRDVRKMLLEDQRAPNYTSIDKMEREFRDYQRDRQSAAKTALRQLLQETRTITHKSLAAVKENPNAMQNIQDVLQIDARYLALDHIADERHQIIMGYLEEMEKKGPPPPPTATEPTRRSKQ